MHRIELSLFTNGQPWSATEFNQFCYGEPMPLKTMGPAYDYYWIKYCRPIYLLDEYSMRCCRHGQISLLGDIAWFDHMKCSDLLFFNCLASTTSSLFIIWGGTS